MKKRLKVKLKERERESNRKMQISVRDVGVERDQWLQGEGGTVEV